MRIAKASGGGVGLVEWICVHSLWSRGRLDGGGGEGGDG